MQFFSAGIPQGPLETSPGMRHEAKHGRHCSAGGCYANRGGESDGSLGGQVDMAELTKYRGDAI